MDRSMRKWIVWVVVAVFGSISSAALATPREARVPLREGKLRTADLSEAICRELHLPRGCAFDCGDIDLHRLRGSLFISALNESLGDGCRLTVADDAVVLHIDADKLPDDVRTAKKAARVFAAVASPEATAKQRAYYGLWIPKEPLDTRKPLVVLIHGLDCDRLNWQPMIDLLHADGRQVAVFTYPSDQPIEDSAASFGKALADLRIKTTNLSYDLICHSMGGLVARTYIEGENYRGGIERLIMLGTPNRGTRWAAYRLALEIDEHFDLWRHDPNWSPSWMITDGLGEAGSDLAPHSNFLEALNALPRREGVHYTIIAGNEHPVRRITANTLDRTAHLIPKAASNWWGFRQTKRTLENTAGRMRQRGGSDGPVAVDRCRLRGVDDFVIVAADHASLVYPQNGKIPAAWDTIRDRLNR
jgi:pimeloyl-ACP methyl ester carboxylesterase